MFQQYTELIKHFVWINMYMYYINMQKLYDLPW